MKLIKRKILISCLRIEMFLYLSPLQPRMLCAKIGRLWSDGFGEEDFQISSMYFGLSFLFPLAKGRAFLNSLQPKIICAKFD